MTADGVLVGVVDVVRGVRENVTPVNPRWASSASRAAVAPASSWWSLSKCVSNASIASSRTEIPRELICAGRPERRGRVSTWAGVSGWNFTVSPSGWGPCRGRSGYRMANDPRSTVYPIARTPRNEMTRPAADCPPPRNSIPPELPA